MSATHNLSTIKRHIKLSDIIGQTLPIKKQSNDQYLGKCPFHSDNTPSFRIYDDTGKYYCFGCQAGGDVFDWLEKQRGMNMTEAKDYLGGAVLLGGDKERTLEKTMEMVFPIPKDAERSIMEARTLKGWNPFTQEHLIHRYTDKDNNLLFCILRLEQNKRNKSGVPFLPIIWGNDNKWHLEGLSMKNRPIYGLPKINTTEAEQSIVVLVEGEKKCDALQKILTSNPVVSWSGGAGAIGLTDWEPLKERKVIFWRDNDEAGLIAEQNICKLLPVIYTIPIPEDKPLKWDCGDAVASGWGFDDVVGLFSKKVLYEAKNEPEESVEIPTYQAEEATSLSSPQLRNLLQNVPGIVGRLAKWIGETAKYPFPGLEFAASAVAVGMAMGHKYCSETDVRTNIYITGFAGASSGKDHARKCIVKLLDKAGEANLEIGVPKSGSGLRTSLKKHCKGILLWDEIGLRFQGIGGHGAGSHQLEIFELLMQAYTSSDGKLTGEEYSNRDGTMSREDIYQPCLGIYGTSTKESFYDAMNSKLAMNGFIPRWLVVEDNLPYRVGKHITGDKNPPVELVEEFKALCEKPLMSFDGNKSTDYLKDHEPIIIPFDDDAREIMFNFEETIVNKQNVNSTDIAIPLDIYRAIWGRAWVSTVKICLVCHEGETISLPVTKWAIELVSYLVDNLIFDLSKYVSDNQYEANVKRLLEVIRKHKGITREQLTYKTRWVRDTKHRTDIIKTLVDSGSIEIKTQKEGTNESAERFYLKKGK